MLGVAISHFKTPYEDGCSAVNLTHILNIWVIACLSQCATFDFESERACSVKKTGSNSYSALIPSASGIESNLDGQSGQSHKCII